MQHYGSLAIAFAARGMGQTGEQTTEAETKQKQVEHRKCLRDVEDAVVRHPPVKEPSVFQGGAVKPE
jgi:hypothetical protein